MPAVYCIPKPFDQPRKDEFELPLLLHASNSPSEHNSSFAQQEVEIVSIC
jgi:hypothetical protein